MTERDTGRGGFTLLETLIAVAIMAVAFSSILVLESSAIHGVEKTRTMDIVAMLAKNAMIEAEQEFQGKTFKEVKEEEKGEFEAPYQAYYWKRTVKELKFPNINFAAMAGGGEEAADSPAMRGIDMLTRLLTKFLSDSVREVTVTISWAKGPGSQSASVSTYWVDLNHEISLNE